MPLWMRVHDPEAPQVWEEAWAITEALVAALAQTCAEHEVAFAVLVVPESAQATTAGRAKWDQRWPETADWDLLKAQARAADMASRHAPTLDLAPGLRAVDARDDDDVETLYYPEDGHWTPRGHRAAAQETAEFLWGLLPAMRSE